MHSLAPLVARHRSDRAARLNAPRAYRVGPRPLPPHHHGGRRLSSRFAVRSRARKARVCEAATPDGRGGDQTRDQSGPLYGERGAERRREARRGGKWRGGKCAERVGIGGRWRDGRAVRAGHSYPTPPRPLLAQMVGIIRLKKYRVLKQRYVDAEPPEPATPLPPDQREPA